jgi:integrase
VEALAEEARAPEAGILGPAEFQRLLQAAAHSPLPCRDRAILCLFWDLAPGVHELLRLRPGDVDLQAGRLLRPDGRRCALGRETTRLLAAYASLERDRRCPRLFSGRHGRPLRAADLDRLCRRLERHTGVAVDPLRLRRAALARLLRADPLPLLSAWRHPAGGAQEPDAARCSAASST